MYLTGKLLLVSAAVHRPGVSAFWIGFQVLKHLPLSLNQFCLLRNKTAIFNDCVNSFKYFTVSCSSICEPALSKGDSFPFCFQYWNKRNSGQSKTKYAFNKFRNSYTFRLKEIIIINLHSKERKNLIIDKIFYISTFTFES